MSKQEDGGGRKRTVEINVDALFEPEPVAPEEARRRELPVASPSSRAVVDLTSPIGHRLRVPPPPAEGGSDPSGTG